VSFVVNEFCKRRHESTKYGSTMTNSRYFLGIICFVSLLALNLFAGDGTPTSAAAELERLRQQAQTARASNNHPARLDAVLKIQKLVHDMPQAVEDAARIYTESGDTTHALAALAEFVELGQTDENLLAGQNKAFASIEKLPAYQAILKRMAENKTAVSHAEQALTIPDPGLVAEDIDYDPQSKSFLITSILEKKIIRLTSDGKTTDFAQSPSHWPMMALKIDAARKLVWATEAALDGFSVAPQSDWGHSAVLCYDLATGTLRSRIEGPPHSALGDMALTRDGTPIVSDGDGGGIYRVNGTKLGAAKLERIDKGDFISPQTPVMHPDGEHLFVPDYLRGIGILEIATGETTWLAPQGKYALSGIDGLYFADGALFATQNGTSPERVIRFQLNPALGQIISEQLIERSTPTLGDPTHGVVVGNSFYYIANSGWDVLDDHGDLKAGAKMTSARIMRFELRKAARTK
jgi:hypothetical protein